VKTRDGKDAQENGIEKKAVISCRQQGKNAREEQS
jgi:hypothetical protein